jgi:DNA mismatch endonuclease (patch repair protein)
VGRLPYPHPTSAEVSKRMRANPRRDTSPEVAVRSQLHRLGLRFRKDRPIRLPERVVRPDVAFPRQRVAVFIDGCFWHRCPIHGTDPKANSAYWRPKLDRNVARDDAVNRQLAAAGWVVVRAWEHEAPAEVARRVADVVRERR